jgi:hypothetical protein
MEQERDIPTGAETKTSRTAENGPEAEGETKKKQDGPGRSGEDDSFAAVLSFSTFILSLTTSMLVNLGELPDPVTSAKTVNLSLAKQTIGLIEMLKEKTRGNLTGEEERLVDTVLFDLRMKYVSTAAAKQ